MVIAAVDPNKKDLAKLVRYLRMVFHGCEVVMFSDPAFAEQYIKDNPIDVLFTEIPMLGLTGLRLQVKCEAVQPGVLTVFTTATDTYVGEALKSRAHGYIIKPVTREAIRESLNDTKYRSRQQGGI